MPTLADIMFPNLKGRWCEKINLNELAKLLGPSKNLIDPAEQGKMLARAHKLLDCDYSCGGYMEDRSVLWAGHYMEPGSMIHLGVDFNVPVGTPVCLPFSGEFVHAIHDKDQNGGWGGRLTFYSPRKNAEFYFILGHLSKDDRIWYKGELYGVGEQVGLIGDVNENGGWFPHLHLQIVSKKEYESYDDPMKIDGYGRMSPDLRIRYPEPYPSMTHESA